LLSAAPKGILSFHHGNMRKYRGMPPALWELFNGEKEMGITVQILSERLDAGMPVVEKSIKIEKADTILKLRNRAQSESPNMMYQALIKLMSDSYKPKYLNKLGKVYTLPNLRQWMLLQWRLFLRRYI